MDAASVLLTRAGATQFWFPSRPRDLNQMPETSSDLRRDDWGRIPNRPTTTGMSAIPARAAMTAVTAVTAVTTTPRLPRLPRLLRLSTQYVTNVLDHN